MASNNNAIVVNYTSGTGTFTVNGKSSGSLASGTETLITNFAGAGDTISDVSVSGPNGSAKISSMSVGGGDNSWSVFVFTDNGYCNVYASPTGDAVSLS